jgi:hypothetical protein
MGLTQLKEIEKLDSADMGGSFEQIHFIRPRFFHIFFPGLCSED